MTDLDRLIEAVEAGMVDPGLFDHAPKAIADHAEVIRAAHYGSTDAAKWLHKTLLPEWRVLQLHEFEAGHWLAQVYHPKADGWPKWRAHQKEEATASILARAWLLAILRALKAKGDA